MTARPTRPPDAEFVFTSWADAEQDPARIAARLTGAGFRLNPGGEPAAVFESVPLPTGGMLFRQWHGG